MLRSMLSFEVYKRRLHKIAKIDPSPLPCGHTVNFEISTKFLLRQKSADSRV